MRTKKEKIDQYTFSEKVVEDKDKQYSSINGMSPEAVECLINAGHDPHESRVATKAKR
jgi:hypothetical protein